MPPRIAPAPLSYSDVLIISSGKYSTSFVVPGFGYNLSLFYSCDSSHSDPTHDFKFIVSSPIVNPPTHSFYVLQTKLNIVCDQRPADCPQSNTVHIANRVAWLEVRLWHSQILNTYTNEQSHCESAVAAHRDGNSPLLIRLPASEIRWEYVTL